MDDYQKIFFMFAIAGAVVLVLVQVALRLAWWPLSWLVCGP